MSDVIPIKLTPREGSFAEHSEKLKNEIVELKAELQHEKARGDEAVAKKRRLSERYAKLRDLLVRLLFEIRFLTKSEGPVLAEARALLEEK